MGHAIFSPSAASRWMHCEASTLYSSIDTTSDAAREGTAAHALAEDEILRRLGWTRTADREQLEYDIVQAGWDLDEMASYVESYVQASVEALQSAAVGMVEASVHAHGQYADLLRGTADLLWIGDDGVLHVWDLKYGRSVRVQARGNAQLLTYAALAMQTIEPAVTYSLTGVRVAIYQPRNGGRSEAYYTCEEVADHYEALIRIVDKRKKAPSTLQYSPSADRCRWCPAKSFCPALVDPRQHQDFLEFIDGDDEVEPDQLENLFDKIPELKAAIDEVESRMRLETEAGMHEAYALKTGSTRRVVTRASEAIQGILDAGRQEVLSYKTPTIKEIESAGLDPADYVTVNQSKPKVIKIEADGSLETENIS